MSNPSSSEEIEMAKAYAEWLDNPVTRMVMAAGERFQLLQTDPSSLSGSPEVLSQYALKAAQSYGRQEMLMFLRNLSFASETLSANYGAKSAGM